MVKQLDIGKVYGAWQVEEKLSYGQKYRCLCTACGITRKNIRVYDILNGKTRACKSCSTAAARATHGMSDTDVYNSWVHMNQRCHNPKNKDYDKYGGRGIQVCEMWRDSFEAFYMYMGDKPDPSFTIERLDYNKGYEPGNCVWASRADQTKNKSDNVVLEIDGVRKVVSEWALEAPVSSFCIYKRISRGWLEKYGAKYTVFTPSYSEDEDEEIQVL